MNQMATAAGVYGLGFSVGVFSLAEVIAWADSEIARTGTPSEELIRLSEAANQHPLDTVALLRDVAGHDGTEQECQVVLGLLSQKLKTGEMPFMEVARAADKLGDIPEDGHWPDNLMNAEHDHRKHVVTRFARHLRAFEARADEWKRSVQSARRD